jgi:hypothetical protein
MERQKNKTRIPAVFARFVIFNKKKAAKHPKIVNLHWSKKRSGPDGFGLFFSGISQSTGPAGQIN